MMKLRLAVANVTGGGLSGGYRKYLKHMFPLLEVSPDVGEMLVLLPPQHSDLLKPSVGHSRTVAVRNTAGAFEELRRFNADVVFTPTARSVARTTWPEVVMVHNMEPLTVPFGGNRLSECIKNLLRSFVAKTACQRATRIIAVSHHVHDFLVSKWNLPMSRIGTVYHGIDLPESSVQTRMPEALAGLSGRFLFTAGSIRPARGLEDAVAAMPRIVRQMNDIVLVVAGKPDPGTQFWLGRLQRLASQLGVSQHIHWAGQLDKCELAWCFRHCEAFVSTTRAEACPFTTLEAMSFGCQTVSTSQAPMPEFLQESAVYYEPKHTQELAAKVVQVLVGPAERRSARQSAALVRARDFDWAKTLEHTVEQFRRAVALFAVRRH